MMILIHAASATLALVLGGLLLARNKRLPFHTRYGAAYHWTMLVVALSALAISLLKGRAVMFTYLAPPSYALAWMGYMSGTRRWSGWLRWHITGQTASYVALLTGLAIQVVPRMIPPEFTSAHRQLVLWSLLLGPALLASPFIARTRARWIRPRPKALRAAA